MQISKAEGEFAFECFAKSIYKFFFALRKGHAQKFSDHFVGCTFQFEYSTHFGELAFLAFRAAFFTM